MIEKEIICGIYKITSPSGKVYIGESKNILYRFKDYKKLRCKAQTKLYNSLLKHNWELHTFEIIEECLFEDLLCRERNYQDIYDSSGKNGLNCKLTKCGDIKQEMCEETKIKIGESGKGRKLSSEHIQKIKDSNKGRVFSDEHCKNLSESGKGKVLSENCKKAIGDANRGLKRSDEYKQYRKDNFSGVNHPMYGTHRSEETKIKIGENNKGNTNRRGKGKKVIDTDTQIIYSSVTEAALAFGYTTSMLSKWLSGTRKNKSNLKFYEYE